MIKEFLSKRNTPSYREKQFNYAFYHQAITSFDELMTWPEDLRKELKEEIPFSTLEPIQTVKSDDKSTIKTLFKTSDNFQIETVLMKFKDDRNTICVSCMSGCPMSCDFCATGQMGFGKNLSVREITDQVLHFKRILNDTNENITNIVFMGMGEPMLNLKNVINSIEILTDPEKLALSNRRITVSTVGIITQLRKFLFENEFKGKLAISLHSPSQNLREELMPKVAKSNPLTDLMELLDEYVEKQNKRVTYEYILIKNVNDNAEQAHRLSKLLKGKLALVNLINFNPSQDIGFDPSTPERIEQFKEILEKNDINVTLRYSPGQDIQAACGQLARRSL